MIDGRDSDLAYELALVEEIVATIGRYNQSHDVMPSAAYLRDTMLSVAALLHIEATKLDETAIRAIALKFESLAIGFAEAAGERMNLVLDAGIVPCCRRRH
jgi:hypothetical protein